MDENRCSWERNASADSSCDLAFQVSLIVISNLGECTPKKPFSGSCTDEGLELCSSLPLVFMVLQPWLDCLQQQWDGSWLLVSLSKALVEYLVSGLERGPLGEVSYFCVFSKCPWLLWHWSGMTAKGTSLELTPGWRNVTEQGWSGSSGLISALNKMTRAVLKHR